MKENKVLLTLEQCMFYLRDLGSDEERASWWDRPEEHLKYMAEVQKMLLDYIVENHPVPLQLSTMATEYWEAAIAKRMEKGDWDLSGELIMWYGENVFNA